MHLETILALIDSLFDPKCTRKIPFSAMAVLNIMICNLCISYFEHFSRLKKINPLEHPQYENPNNRPDAFWLIIVDYYHRMLIMRY